MKATIILPLVCASAAIFLPSCADNPADDVVDAKVEEPGNSEQTPSAPAPSSGDVKTFVFNAGSKIEFVGSKVTGSHTGGFNNFTGYFNVDMAAETLAKSQTHSVMIDMSSTYSDNEKLTTHLKSADFFDVGKYPSARFVLNSAKTEDGENYQLSGKLDLHGVTKAISFPATVSVSEGKDTVTVKSEFNINRQDFAIKYEGMPDDLIRDEVVIRFDITAVPGEKKSLEIGATTGSNSGPDNGTERRGEGGRGGSPDERFARLDTNGDGKLTKDEVPEQAWQFLSQADSDQDDIITMEELAAMPRRQGGPGGGNRRGGGDPAEMFARMDADKDGKISQSEAPERFWERLSEAGHRW